jgi:uncharacterized protein (DUF2249 family)
VTHPFEGPVTSLDVRPLLAEGTEPFEVIMAAVESLPPGGVLELTVPFEPVPLYAVLRARGFDHVVVQSSASAHVVRFVRPGLADPPA